MSRSFKVLAAELKRDLGVAGVCVDNGEQGLEEQKDSGPDEGPAEVGVQSP